MKTGCFILSTTGFFARFPTEVLPKKRGLHRTLPEKTCPENNLVRSWTKLLTSSHSDQSMGDGLFPIQGLESVNGIYLLSSALVHFPELRDTRYVEASLIHDSAVASSMPEKGCKSLQSTDSFLKDMVTTKTGGDCAWENSYWAEHSTSSCGTQRLLLKAWLRKLTKMSQWTQWKPLLGRAFEQ